MQRLPAAHTPPKPALAERSQHQIHAFHAGPGLRLGLQGLKVEVPVWIVRDDSIWYPNFANALRERTRSPQICQ